MSKGASSGVVVGSGVVGMTSAIRLAEAGHGVEIWARELPPHTTSNVAAALWYPYRAGPADRVEAWSHASYAVFCEHAREPASGVTLVAGVELFPSTEDASTLIRQLPGFRPAEPSELPSGGAHEGTRAYVFEAPVIEMPLYLAFLLARVRALGIAVHERVCESLEQALEAGDWVVNCTGLGARELAGDAAVYPIRGQLVRTERAGIERFVLDEHGSGGITYVVPRSRDCILGGTAEEHSDDLAADDAESAAIRARCGELEPRIAGARTLGVAVGLRPGRGEVRLELESSPGAGPIVHNYGHGGAGVTLSWGCAAEVRDTLASAL